MACSFSFAGLFGGDEDVVGEKYQCTSDTSAKASDTLFDGIRDGDGRTIVRLAERVCVLSVACVKIPE